MSTFPDWIPEEAWAEFLAMRKRIKMPLTEYGQKLAIRKLEALKKEGQDPQLVLDEAIMRQWRGLFAVTPIASPTSPAQLSLVANRDWHMSDAGIIAKAKECGLNPRAGETYYDIKKRVMQHLDDQQRGTLKRN